MKKRIKKAKPVKAWAVYTPERKLFSLGFAKHIAIAQAENRLNDTLETIVWWGDMKREGYRCVRVQITELRK